MVPATLNKCLQRRAIVDRDALAFRFYDGGGRSIASSTYGELDRRADSLGAHLRRIGVSGQRVVLTYSPGLAFVEAFYGCLYAGAIPVPAYPPDPRRLDQSLPRLDRVIADSGARLVLADRRLLVSLQRLDFYGRAASWLRDAHWHGTLLFGHGCRVRLQRIGRRRRGEAARVQWLATDDLASADQLGRNRSSASQPPGDTDSVAYLQYTSGSTMAPRGVCLTHANVLANVAMAARMIGLDRQTVAAGWAPLYHDLGLVCYVIASVVIGFPSHLMSPKEFLRRPLAWLELVSQVRATHAGAPDFAYQLCVRKSDPASRARLDLRSWRVAGNGGETVRSTTLDGFSAAFRDSGFQRAAFMPCYGAAEATLFIASGKVPGQPPRTLRVDADALARHRIVRASADAPDAMTLVGHGRTGAGHELRIVKPGTIETLADGRIGEILFRGPSVAVGYHGTAPGTAPFGVKLVSSPILDQADAPQFLRTGDLGCICDGELFVTGRCRDVLIVQGRNLYPTDLEASLETVHPAIRPGCSAVFATAASATEQMVVVAEVDLRRTDQDSGLDDIGRRIMQCLATRHDVQVDRVVLIATMALPKTSSGKVQRSLTRELLGSGALHVHFDYRRDEPTAIDSGDSGSPEAMSIVRDELVQATNAVLRGQIRTGDPATLVELDSLSLIELVEMVHLRTGVLLESRQVLDTGTPEELAHLIIAQPGYRGWRPLHRDTDGANRQESLPPGLYRAVDVQRLFWNMQQRLPGIFRHHAVLDITGDLVSESVERAWSALLQDNPVLRASHAVVHAEHLFSLVELDGPAVQWLDASDWSEARQRDNINEQYQRRFDLTTPPLARCIVYRRGESRYRLQLVCHQIAADLWSFSRLIDDLLRLIGSMTRGAHVRRHVMPLPVSTATCGTACAFKLGRVAKLAPSPPRGVLLYSTTVHRLVASQLRQLHLRAIAWRVPLSTLLFAPMVAAVAEHTGRHELLVAMPVSTRMAAAPDVSGPMMNFLPVVVLHRRDTPPQQRAGALARAVGESLLHRREEVGYAADGQDFPDVHFSIYDFNRLRMSDRLKNLHSGSSIRVGDLDVSMQSVAGIESQSPVAVGMTGVMIHGELILWMNGRPDVLSKADAEELMQSIVDELDVRSLDLSV